jgi:hypothetical protein
VLSGDGPRPQRRLAGQAGIDQARGRRAPQDKLDHRCCSGRAAMSPWWATA